MPNLIFDSNVNICSEKFQTILKSCVGEMVCEKQLKDKMDSYGWINKELELLKLKRDKSYKIAIYSHSSEIYRGNRNNYKNTIFKTKHNFIKSRISECSQNQKELWKMMKTYFIGAKQNSNVKMIDFDGNIISESTEIANLFNEYFIKICLQVN